MLLQTLTNLHAFKEFLSSPMWHAFAKNPAYLQFACQYRTKIPNPNQFLAHEGGMIFTEMTMLPFLQNLL
jgi:hypothetical protein